MQDFENIPPDFASEDAFLKGKRRSKVDPEGRSYLCGCGKNYLSYPALYTHIKNKHAGAQPDGTTVPNGRSGRARGRPRKSQEDCSYFHQKGYFGGPSDPLAGFHVGDGSQHRDVLLELVTRRVEQGPTDMKTCNEILAAYLVDVAQVMKQEYYIQFVLYVQCLRRCLNQHGWRLPNESPAIPSEEYCSTRDASNLPEVSNHLISDFLPQECPSLDRKAAIEMTLHLNKWLYERRLSRLKLSVVGN